MRQAVSVMAAMLCGPLVCAPQQSFASPSSGPAAELGRAFEEFDQSQEVRSSQPDRARQLLASAAQRFESLTAAGIANGYLEYNLGNTYLLLNDVGRAILHYRRAERLIPRDPLLAENLAVARTRCLLSIPPARKSAVYQGIFFWHYQSSPRGRFAFAVFTYVLFWVLLGLRSLFRRGGLSVGAGASAMLCMAAAGSLFVQLWQDRNAPDAVVVANDVAVYKGPGSTYQKQFEQPLQPGVELKVREQRGEWSRIELSDGGSGWVPKDTLEAVPPQIDRDNQVSLVPW